MTLTNVGSMPTDGSPIVIVDALPPHLKPVTLSGLNLEREFGHAGWTCSVARKMCRYEGTVAAGGTLVFELGVEVEGPSPPEVGLNAVTVTGGGAKPISTSEPLTIPNTIGGAPSAFGIAAFGVAAHDLSGDVDAQAADHPNALTTTVNLNTVPEAQVNGRYVPASVAPPRDLVVYLPLGLAGDPTAAARCTERQLTGNPRLVTENECPAASRAGIATLFISNEVSGTLAPEGEATAVYNMVPDDGYPAQFGFKLAGVPVPIYASLVHLGSGYALRVGTPGIPTTLNVEGAAFTFFGDPRTMDGEPSSPQAFFTNPGNCSAGPLKARVEADSWAAPGQWAVAESVSYPQITGCDLLQFEPEIAMRPEVTQAEAPSGYEIKIKVPQNPDRFPVLAIPQLKDVTMRLPDGMTVSPGAGDGLAGCEASGPNGIDMPAGSHTPTEAGEGEAIGADGLSHLTAGHCPQSSQIGTVEITTPILASPLEGHLYVAAPQCGGPGQALCTPADATNGRLFGLYLEAEGSGAVVKLKGSVSVSPSTGQVTAQFTENPQLPVSEVTLHLQGGGRAPLANPRQCGQALAYGDLTPWSSPVTPDALPSAAFTTDWDGQGGACPATPPFAPTLSAGSTNPAAARFSPFTLTVSRGDRQQDMARLQVKMPAGLLGMLSSVPLCGEPQAAQGTCAETSRIGTTWVAAGSGSQPLWVSGRVYLTGPYAGAPFGLSVVVPAVAGPFHLGDVVVRSRINIDPSTAAVTITSDPLPQFLEGIPLRIQTLHVVVDRPGFLFNPTSCAAEQVQATIEAEQGASASPSTPFAVEGCKSLPFNPGFKVATRAPGSKKRGTSFDVKVSSTPGQANIHSVMVKLPKQLPARLTTLQQACPEATFAANPATCPAGANVGTAKAVTPVLNEPLTGPAYLVSHGGAAFPDLVVILQGQGIRLDLVGNTNIKKGITTSTFGSVPDAPVTSFELKLPAGPHSALTSNGSLCAKPLRMATTLVGANGRKLVRSVKVAVAGCPRTATTRKARK